MGRRLCNDLSRENENAVRVGTSKKGKAEFQGAEKIFVSWNTQETHICERRGCFRLAPCRNTRKSGGFRPVFPRISPFSFISYMRNYSYAVENPPLFSSRNETRRDEIIPRTRANTHERIVSENCFHPIPHIFPREKRKRYFSSDFLRSLFIGMNFTMRDLSVSLITKHSVFQHLLLRFSRQLIINSH